MFLHPYNPFVQTRYIVEPQLEINPSDKTAPLNTF